MKKGYNVYHAPEGSGQEFLGFARTLKAARKLAAHGGKSALPEHLYTTAWESGSPIDGLRPPAGNEAEDAAAWFGRGGEYCAVAVTIDD